MSSGGPWSHRNARKLMGCFRAAVLLEHGIEEGAIPDPQKAEVTMQLLEEVRRLGAKGRQLVLTAGPADRAVAAIVREMDEKLNEALSCLGEL